MRRHVPFAPLGIIRPILFRHLPVAAAPGKANGIRIRVLGPRGAGAAREEKVEYIHLNPVRAGLVERAEDWPWSSVRDYSGSLKGATSANRFLAIDRILLPADERTRI
jgi:hypothetical protein